VAKWQCSEEAARAAAEKYEGMNACPTSKSWQHNEQAMRLAITAAVGPEVEALRQLAEESTRAHVAEVVSRQNAEQQRDAALARMAALEAEAVAHPERWTYWRSRSADMTSSWRIQRDRVRRVVAIARRLRAERDAELAASDELVRALDSEAAEAVTLCEQRDAAAARAEQAERERDEARKQLENVLDAHQEGGWQARALDAERDLVAMRGERGAGCGAGAPTPAPRRPTPEADDTDPPRRQGDQ
jgi:hypothetical protein